ncbi:IucA/IucC family protein [Streptomyces gilvosporeus]|uniref:Iron transporter n=1 Tax=Streptomyces gilvosporeus TaxID=553510 RepID=A0A1V0TNB6_9ACTN|nr:IucA/IucC family protein [Streptomyces gilvosporeus]ARF54162.1 iron transporter [Streptomyces gilvosporeus]
MPPLPHSAATAQDPGTARTPEPTATTGTTRIARTAPIPAPAPAGPPTADQAVAHTLLNCLLREVSGPEHQTAVDAGHLLLRLPRRGVLLRVALRRTSLIGAHRFAGPVTEEADGGWREVGWRRLAEYVHAELSLRTGVHNDEFLDQIASSHQAVAAALDSRAPGGHGTDGQVPGGHGTDGQAPGGQVPGGQALATGPADSTPPRVTPPHADWQAAYLASEQSLVLGHRFHPTPKARSGDPASWRSYAPEAGASFPLLLLAVREDLIVEEAAEEGAAAPLDALHPGVPDGYRLLPVHPWQYELLRGHPGLKEALDRGDLRILGTGGTHFAATASVRTLYDGASFLKFSLNVRITNCLRKNASYELSGAVALTRLLAPVLADLAARFPGSAVLREPVYRSLALPGPDGRPDTGLLEGFGVIVRERLSQRLLPGTTPLLAAAVADEYPHSPAHISRLLDGAGPQAALDWWAAYLDLLLPPVLAAYFDHGVVLEPHLQNVLVCVDGDGMPAQVLFRDLEGTKLVPEHHAGPLASLPEDVAGPMTYDAQRGWDRVVYCLLVNHVAEMLAALADLHPGTEADLWAQVRRTLQVHADRHGCPPRLAALLAGVPLPAKANLLTRWERRADREAGYVLLPSPLAESVLTGAVRTDDTVGTDDTPSWSAR